MKQRAIISIAFILAVIVITYVSCAKEHSCENCYVNNIPVANAGYDTIISLPVDSITLDGSKSTDPNNNITGYQWRKIAGPDTFTIVNNTSIKTTVKGLVKAVYQFELKVTDKGGLSATDTMQVTIIPRGGTPPVARAGNDTIIISPASTIVLNGNASADPDNNITSYSWKKIAGPSNFTIANANAAQTQVSDLTEGIYQFELKVTDAGGLFSADSLTVTINPASITACNNIPRPLIAAQLLPISTLSQTRQGFVIASAANKILIAGGYIHSGNYIASSRVDIFDIATNSWTTAELSEARYNIATAVLGSKIFFAGGSNSAKNNSKTIDIYDAAANTWTTAELSTARSAMTGAAVGHNVLFAGGFDGFFRYSNAIDIYDTVTQKWQTSVLSDRINTEAVGMSATVAGDKIYFAGNASDWFGWDYGSITSTINIYDATTGNWSSSALKTARGFQAGITAGNKNYWAGGLSSQPQLAYGPFTNEVEIRDINSGISRFECLFQPNGFFSAVQKGNNIVYFTAGIKAPDAWVDAPHTLNKFDIYNITKDEWSIGVLPVNIYGSSIISVNNTIYVAGGYVNDVLSNKVSKLVF